MRKLTPALVGALLLIDRGHAAPDTGALPAIIESAGIAPQSRVAVFLPNSPPLANYICSIVGSNEGRVYLVELPASSDAERAAINCTNSTTIRLQARKASAPELYNSSDDPGAVYEYYTTLSPIETFVAPESLDAILIGTSPSELGGERFSSPYIRRVLAKLHGALKPGGALVTVTNLDHSETPGNTQSVRLTIETINREVSASGFERRATIDSSRRSHESGERLIAHCMVFEKG